LDKKAIPIEEEPIETEEIIHKLERKDKRK
jgi:hypothetical protein